MNLAIKETYSPPSSPSSYKTEDNVNHDTPKSVTLLYYSYKIHEIILKITKSLLKKVENCRHKGKNVGDFCIFEFLLMLFS